MARRASARRACSAEAASAAKAGSGDGPRRRGSIPVLLARGGSLAEAWENSLLSLHERGAEIRTEYDEKDASGRFIDPPSLDATMVMVVEEPASEPFIHRAFPGGLEDLEEYRQEVLDGIKDHWVRNPDDPEDKRWEYTYHARLFSYDVPDSAEKTDQLAEALDRLARSPYTRRAQAITWQVWADPDCYDPPCLQSVWLRVAEDEDGTERLNMNVRFRSRDAYDAAFMNCFALVSLQERLAGELAGKTGREIRLGRYCDISDSYHIYGRRRGHFEGSFLRLVRERPFEERTWTREFAEPVFCDARPRIEKKVKEKDARDAHRSSL